MCKKAPKNLIQIQYLPDASQYQNQDKCPATAKKNERQAFAAAECTPANRTEVNW